MSRLNGWPIRSPTDASPTSSRTPAHGSGATWIATPSPQWTFTTYSLPVSRRTYSRCGLHTRAVTKFVTAIRGLQTFRLLHACPGCFRLERSPGGACTRWKGAALSRRTWLPVLGTRGFHRPLSDPSTDLQVRCHRSDPTD